MRKNSKKIGLFGPYGFGNLGDAAIQQSVVYHINKYCPSAQIFGFSLNPADTEERHGIPSFPISNVPKEYLDLLNKISPKVRYHPFFRMIERVILRIPLEILLIFKEMKLLRGFDYLVISGGGQLDEFWGGPFQQPYRLLKWALIAKLRRVKLVILSVGVGQLNSSASKSFVKYFILLSDYCSYRDVRTKKTIEQIAVRPNNLIYPDLAYSLEVNRKKITQNGKYPIVGISPMAYRDPRIWPESDYEKYRSYIHKLAQFSFWLIQSNYQIVFFVSQINHDIPTVIDVIEELEKLQLGNPEKMINVIELGLDIKSVEDLINQIAKTDIVIATRLHSVILSHLLYKPVVAISYQDKVYREMENKGQSDYCLDIDHFDFDELKTKFIDLEVNREIETLKIMEKIEEFRNQLDEQYSHIFTCD